MTVASWLFVTTTLVNPGVAPGSAPAITAPSTAPSSAVSIAPVSFAAPAETSGEPQVRPVQAAPVSSAPHTLSFGGSVVAGSNGVSGGVNYWFNEHIGVNMAVGYFIMPHYYSTSSSGSTFQAAPSVMVMLTKADQSRDVNIRPFVGAGINYVSSSQPSVATRTTNYTTSGTSEQAFGGIEMSFKDTPGLALTFQAAYYNLPNNFVGTGYVGGLNWLFGAHFYVK
jgi:hypothetical protein